MKILMADVGGSSVKLMAHGQETTVKVPSGPRLTPRRMVKDALAAMKGWRYDAVSIGYPGVVIDGRPAIDPPNLGRGWVGFDYARAFGKPVRIINDAAMQALGNYASGRMLFLGFGTGVGCTLISEDLVVPVDIGILRLRRRASFKDRLGDEALLHRGRRRWTADALEAIAILGDVFKPDRIVLGGGNAKLIEPLPKGCVVRDNGAAFEGARRLWPGAGLLATPCGRSWRLRRRL